MAFNTMFTTFTRPVYCYYFPEVRRIIDSVSSPYPHDIYLKSIDPGLDDFHVPVIETFVRSFRDYMPGLASFANRYVTNGSSEGIFQSLALIAAKHDKRPLYVVEGEYEGYMGYGRNLGLSFTVVPDGTDPKNLKPGIFYISNPSSRNGNTHSNAFITSIGDAGHEIYLDCTYAGMTSDTGLLVDHPSISTVFTSMSKAYGLYYYRVGFTFTRHTMPTLEVNKWFKNIFSLVVANALLTRLPVAELYANYRPLQVQIIEETNRKLHTKLQPSGVYLLAYVDPKDIPQEQAGEYATFHRGGSYYRFGLTPHFLMNESR